MKVEDDPRDVNQRILTVQYPVTKAPVPITDLDLSSKVPAPVLGGTAVGYFGSLEYTGTVTWNSGIKAGDIFAAGVPYTAEVTLTPAAGYTIDAEGLAFTHVDSSSISSGGNKVTINFPTTSSAPVVKVKDMNLTEKVPAPVLGGIPLTYFATSEYTGTVTWSKTSGGSHSGAFAALELYRATVTLKAAPGYTFTGVKTSAFFHDEATVNNADDSMVVTIDFSPTGNVEASNVTEFDLTYLIPKPENGGTPTLFFAGRQYNGEVSWDSVPSGGLFRAGTSYTATVTLRPVSGYKFGVLKENVFTYTGATSTNLAYNGQNTDSVIVKLVFPATKDAGAGGYLVDDTDLRTYIPAPVNSGTPVWYFSAPQYRGTVKWTPEVSDGLFGGGMMYQATIELVPVSGYTFNGIKADAFTHSGATTEKNDAGEDGLPKISLTAGTVKNTDNTITVNTDGNNKDGMITVLIVFPKTSGVTDLDLTNKVPAPAQGMAPTDTFSTLQYTGKVEWNGEMSNGTFKSGEKYTAVVTLTAVPPYTFNGIKENAFTHSSAESTPTYATGSRKVTISFLSMVSDTELSTFLSAPMVGKSPVTDINGVQYTGQMRWWTGTTLHSGVFQAGVMYSAVLTLTAKKGYTFNGIKENAFTHSGGTVTHPDGTGSTITVTVDFRSTSGSGSTSLSFASILDSLKTNSSGDYVVNNKNEGVAFNAGGSYANINENDSNTYNAVIDGEGATISMTGTDYKPILTVGRNATVTLKNITFIGVKANTQPLFKVVDGGKLILEGATIKNNNSPSNSIGKEGGDVSVESGGILIMNSGSTICGNNGIGVKITGGTFTMYSGVISGNSKRGVSVESGGTFTMYGGGINGNSGGVSVTDDDSTFTMNGGGISGNTASAGGGVSVESGGTFTMYGGGINGNSGGVSVTDDDSTFTMNGGGISGNTASAGGGVSVESGGKFTMQDGTISGNTASANEGGNGGGVYVNGGTFTKTGGTIYGTDGGSYKNISQNSGNTNTAQPAEKGHAVYVDGSPVKYRSITAGPGDNLDSGTDTNWGQ